MEKILAAVLSVIFLVDNIPAACPTVTFKVQSHVPESGRSDNKDPPNTHVAALNQTHESTWRPARPQNKIVLTVITDKEGAAQARLPRRLRGRLIRVIDMKNQKIILMQAGITCGLH